MKTISYNIVLILLLIGFSMPIKAQSVGTWKEYKACQNAMKVVETETLVYALYESLYKDGKSRGDGSLVSYDPNYDEVYIFSLKDGLSDTGIKLMEYNPKHNAFVLVYNNSNVDIFYGKNNVVNLRGIIEKNYPDNTINRIDMIDDLAYISSAFGVVVIDIEKGVIKSTYDTGVENRSVCRKDEYLYVATVEGFKKGLLSTNLMDQGNWIEVGKDEINYDGDFSRFRGMSLYNGRWLFWGDSSAHYQNTDGSMKQLYDGAVRDLAVINDQIVLALWGAILFYPNPSDRYQVNAIKAYSIASSKTKDAYWFASGSLGILQLEIPKESNQYTTLISDVLINSPLRNSVYEMTFSQNKLLVSGGGRYVDNLNNPGTLMVYENKKWFNFDDQKIESQTGVTCRDFMTPVIDPKDPNHYFVGSWGEGIYEFKNNEFVVPLYNQDNSSLRGTSSGKVRVYGLAYDSKGNLYATNDEVQNGVSVLDANGNWESIYIPSLSDKYLHSVFVDKQDNKWFTRTRGATHMGVTVLKSDRTYYFSSNFLDQNGDNVGASTYNCVAQDLSGSIWVGTDNGPIRLSGANSVNQGLCSRDILKDEYGTNYRLLEGKNITTIAVDGGNRKWMGTNGSGVFMVDNTGSEIIVENFTTKNSLLMSDNITSIAINNSTGEIFIGTDKGLVSYQGEAITGKADYSNVYAYPNPVYPDRNDRVIVTGLMADSEIKITDLAGNLIQKGISLGGQYSWDLTDNQGRIVKSGIYLVFAAQNDGSSGVATKIMVIK
ncbi:hypothetical protein LJB98_04175 [Bacteroidales bacterium OttesenSCG-928-M11]|nr:hypothetical protein [Bacteroidales bacterium OttesenSCG-928-M11]